MSDEVVLDDVSWETFCAFWEWSYIKEPRIGAYTLLDEVIELGIFATKYQARALQHEVSDLLRQKISRKDWKLGSMQIKRMLSCDEESAWLRQLVYASLCTIVVAPGGQQKGEVKEWMNIFEQDHGLARKWKRSDFMRFGASHIMDGGACRFHDHGLDMTVKEGSGVCPYRLGELYPKGEEGKGRGKSKARRRDRMEVTTTVSESEVCTAEDVMVEDIMADELVMVEEAV